MAGVAVHVCKERDEMGTPLKPDMATCGSCNRSWCFRCEPTPAHLCPWCNGYGYSQAPIPPRQVRTINRHYVI